MTVMVTDQASTAAQASTLCWAEVRPALLRAAAALWLPALLPFVFGPLTECTHCVQEYLQLLAVEPGFLAAMWCRNGPGLHTVGGLATLLLLALVATLIGVAGRRWWLVAIPVAVLAGVQALGLGYLLRR